MPQTQAVAALVSGLDSAIMAGLLTREYQRVTPLFVRAGLQWEDAERDALERYFEALGAAAVQPLVELDLGARSLYGRHWSTGGEAVPDASRPDEEWYLPGRNLLLLSTAATYGAIHGIAHISHRHSGQQSVSGRLGRSSFAAWSGPPDSRWMRRFTSSRRWPDMHKADVIRAGAHLPVQHALSCADPVDGGHCGVCGKCGERRRGFIDAGVDDPTQLRAARPALGSL